MLSWRTIFASFTVLYGCLHATYAVTGHAHGKIVVCYLGTWSVYRPDRGSFTIEHLDPSLCTHIIYAFAGLDVEEDSIKPLDKWQDLADEGKAGFQRITALRQKYPLLKVTLALGGWNEGSANYSALVSDQDRRRNFVKNAVSFIQKHKFDGLDLDWEFPGKRGGTPDDKLNFFLLVKELKAAFKKHNLILTAAFGAGKDTIDVAYDVEGLSTYLDFIHMMCYDYHGAWDKRTGANSPLFGEDYLNVNFTINYMLQMGAPAHKLVLGLPLYGRTFVLPQTISLNNKPKLGMPSKEVGFPGPYTGEKGFMGYNEICLELHNKSSNWTRFWDKASHTPFAIRQDQIVNYDDEESLTEKVQLALKYNLGGVMVWSIDTDDFHGDCSKFAKNERGYENFPLMRSINRALHKSAKPPKIYIPEIDKNGSDTLKSTNSLLLAVLVLLRLYNFCNFN